VLVAETRGARLPSFRRDSGFCVEKGLAPSGPIEKRWFGMAWNLHHFIPMSQLVLAPRVSYKILRNKELGESAAVYFLTVPSSDASSGAPRGGRRIQNGDVYL
jgi:hypothetical protein